MAICKYCEQEMNEADGCVKMPVRTTEGKLDPIPYGDESQHAKEAPAPGQYHHGVLIDDPPRCHDCSTLPGHYHHPGCDWEECPRCHEQLIGCDCDLAPGRNKDQVMSNNLQRAKCAEYGATFVCAADDVISGVAMDSLQQRPIHGLRHHLTEDTTGWYIWCGELSQAPNFFRPTHTAHLAHLLPEAVPFLALPPGYRFLLADGYEDVWFDDSLLALPIGDPSIHV